MNTIRQTKRYVFCLKVLVAKLNICLLEKEQTVHLFDYVDSAKYSWQYTNGVVQRLRAYWL